MTEVSENKPRTPEQNNFNTESRTKIMHKSILTIFFWQKNKQQQNSCEIMHAHTYTPKGVWQKRKKKKKERERELELKNFIFQGL